MMTPREKKAPSMEPRPLVPPPTQAEAETLRTFITQSCGLIIPPEKYYLIGQRLEDLARSVGGGTFGGLSLKLTQDPSGLLRDQVIEAITTNETSFFRDGHPFETIRDHVLPLLLERFSRARVGPAAPSPAQIRIWCCGASTGQEPYSLAMTLDQFARYNRYRGIALADFRILASDISQPALHQAKSGVYSDFEISRGLPEDMKRLYFRRAGQNWAVKPEITGIIDWMKVNLQSAFTLLGSFQMILCRNVLIYFDDAMKAQVIERFHRMLEEGGFLLLGSTEILMDQGGRFQSIRRGNTILYQKIGR